MFQRLFNLISKHKSLSLILLYIVTRFGVFFYPINSDYYIFYTIGKRWFQGEKLYTELFDHKPPLIFFFNGILSLISDNIWIQRLVLIILSIVSIYLFKKLIDILIPKLFKDQNISESNIQFILLAIFIFLLNLAQIAAFGNNTENLSLPFTLLIFILYYGAKYRQTPEPKTAFLIGVIISVAFQIKINILVLYIPIILDILFSTKDLKCKFKLIPSMLAGFLPLNIIIFIYFYLQGSFNDFITATYTFSAKYAAVNQFGNIIGIRAMLNNLFLSGLVLLPYGLGIVIYLKNLKGRFITKFKDNIFLQLIIPLSTFIMAGTFFPYYLLSLVPFISIGYVTFVIYICMQQKHNILSVALKAVLIVCISLSFFYSMKQPYNTFFGSIKEDTDNMKQAAEYVKENSEETDKIYANVYGSTFYYFANRDNFSRFSSTSHILLDSKYNFGYHFAEEWKAKAEEVKPKFIIREKQDLYGRVLDEYIDTKYREIANFGEYLVWQRIETVPR